MLRQSEFVPAWWLKNPHLQTIWGSLLRAPVQLALKRERLILPDGDFLDLDWLDDTIAFSTERPLVLILHGLGGSIHSHYAKAIMQILQQQGWNSVFMHYRGCSGDPNLRLVSYHCGFTDDLDYVVQILKLRFPQSPLAAIGYSLGGSILLNWLAKTGKVNPLTAAIAVSVPFELENAANRMLNGFSRLYQWHLLKSLRQNVNEKFTVLKNSIDLQQLEHLTTFWEFDTFVTAPLHGFKNAEDYYEKASCRKQLGKIAKPTFIFHAIDDPFMLPEAIPLRQELACDTVLELSQNGGHVGFIEGNLPGSANYWLEKRIATCLNEFFPLCESQTNSMRTILSEEPPSTI